MKMWFASRQQQRTLALAGQLDLRPAYAVMGFNVAISYLSAFFYGQLRDTDFARWVCAFGMLHFAAVRGAADLAADGGAISFVMTIQWLLSATYLVMFMLYLSPFSTIVRVATDKVVKRDMAGDDDEKRKFMRLIVMLLGLLMLAADIGLIRMPTFLNGGLFAPNGGSNILVHFLDATAWMPLCLWFAVFATFMVYWCWFHMAVNFRTIFDV